MASSSSSSQGHKNDNQNKKAKSELVEQYLKNEKENDIAGSFFRLYAVLFAIFALANILGYVYYEDQYRPKQVSIEVWNLYIPIGILGVLLIETMLILKVAFYCVRSDHDGRGWRAASLWLIVLSIFFGGALGWEASQLLTDFLFD